jgi:predicted dehydrogenase
LLHGKEKDMRSKVAVVGAGYWGPNLIRNFYQLPTAELTWCCDADESKLEKLLGLYPGVRGTTDFNQLLNDSELEAIVLATPARTHYALARQALLAGKHVLVEKPLAMSTAEAIDVTQVAGSAGRVLMVGHVFEYNPAVLHIKQLLDENEIGSVYYIYSNRVNLGRVQSDINALWSIAPHDISILLFLLGAMPETVSARGGMYLNGQVEDVVFMNLVFPGNILGHVQVSWLDPSKVRRMTIVGSTRMIVYDDVADEGKVKIYDKGVYRKTDDHYGEFQYKVHSGDIYIPKIEMTEPLRSECAHFIECVQEHTTPRTDGRNGLRVVQVLEAAQRSLDQGGAAVLVSDTLSARIGCTASAGNPGL